MEPDSYQIDVLHYLNPHLMWVEVVPSKNEEFVFEQIGVYGILPMEVNIDLEEQRVQGKKSFDWAPAIVKIMKDIFGKAEEIWFRPVFIDRSSSIFDTNIHKYGEVIIKLADGSTKDFAKLLLKSCFAHFNAKEFLKEITLCNLKTKLDATETRAVIKALTKTETKKAENRDKSLNEQMVVTNTAKELESALTESNLNKHNFLFKEKTVYEIIEQKLKDLELCKDVDEVSVGSGISGRPSSIAKKENVSVASKRMELYKKVQATQNESYLDVLTKTKDLLLKYAEIKIKLQEVQNPVEPQIKFQQVQSFLNTLEESEPVVGPKEMAPERTITPVQQGSTYHTTSKKKKKKVPNPYQTDYDMERETRIAIGPPDVDPKTIFPKIVPKMNEDQGYGNGLSVDKPVLAKEVKDQGYGHKTVDKPIVANVKDAKDICEKVSEKLNKLIERNDDADLSQSSSKSGLSSKLRNKYKILNLDYSSDTTTKDESNESKTQDSDAETTLSDIVRKLNISDPIEAVSISPARPAFGKTDAHVNPFKNTDPTISKFVDKLSCPVLLVHSSDGKRIQPVYNLSDVCFSGAIHSVLARNSVKGPTTLQTVSWFAILRGYSVFMVSPMGSGKTLGYIPAVSRLVDDFDEQEIPDSAGPICVIVCGTAKSVIEVERQCRMYLGSKKAVVACYAGLDEMDVTNALLNGCHVLVATPSAFVRLLNAPDFGVDIKRLTTFVLDDCERLNEVYLNELKFFQLKIKEMLKARANKVLKVQYVIASRLWCGFLDGLVKKTPNPIVCISAFQESVLYSKCGMSVNFVEQTKKIDAVLEFLNSVDSSKKTVIVCKTGAEVDYLDDALKKRYTVFAANEDKTIEELYVVSSIWSDYEVPTKSPVLVCYDTNLTHLNITDAYNLLHYSLPHLFSMFARRFAVLIDNYPSVFVNKNNDVKIKILLDSDNMEQLPKILNFVRRCEHDVPETLNEISNEVLKVKDMDKARSLVPLCDHLLGLRECPDVWNCKERHTVLKEFDNPKEWMPQSGVVTFKIIQYHTPVKYSVRLTGSTIDGKTKKYPQTYSGLSLKMGLYFSKESNRKLHGEPEVGDVCAVALKDNFYQRCQVVKILTRRENGMAHKVVVNLIDLQNCEIAHDVHLYHLPEMLKIEQTYAAIVRLVKVQPRDRDVTYPDIARNELKRITDANEELYIRARVVATINNSIIVDTLEACQDLTSSKETVVRSNMKEMLLQKHAIPNPDYVDKLERLSVKFNRLEKIEHLSPEKEQEKGSWAFLTDGMQEVYVSATLNPESFFIRLYKFDDCLELLEKDIQKYVADAQCTQDIREGIIVLAKFPADDYFYRARIDTVGDRIDCLFVDHGDWGTVDRKDIYPIPDRFVSVLPFQAIESRLLGIQSHGNSWTEYSTNWFHDQTVLDKDLKVLQAKFMTKEQADYTDGYKHGIVLIDDQTVINKTMVDLNLAVEVEEEMDYVNEVSEQLLKEKEMSSKHKEYDNIELQDDRPAEHGNSNIFGKGKLLRSMVIESDEDLDKWDMGFDDEEVVNLTNEIRKGNNPFLALPAPKSPNTSLDSSKLDFEVITKETATELDSDDISTSESILVSEIQTKNDLSDEIKEVATLRRPKLVWLQNNDTVTIRVELIAVERYEVTIEARKIHFKTTIHDTNYGFEIELYGFVDVNASRHEKRGLGKVYIKLKKCLKRNWLSLTKEGIHRWIVYDVDGIEASSSEDDVEDEKKKIKQRVDCSNEASDASSHEDFVDDAIL